MAKPLVVVTGASSGIGAATAQAFAADGHPLLLLARRLDRMEALKLPNAMCRAVDVRDRAAVERAVAEAEVKYGPTDCLFNNAGIARLGDITKQAPAEWDEMIDINVNGMMNGVHAVMSGMIARQASVTSLASPGRIVIRPGIARTADRCSIG